MRPSNNLENKSPLDTYWRVQLVCKKVQTHSSLEPPLEYNQNQMVLTSQGSLWLFWPSILIPPPPDVDAIVDGIVILV